MQIQIYSAMDTDVMYMQCDEYLGNVHICADISKVVDWVHIDISNRESKYFSNNVLKN